MNKATIVVLFLTGLVLGTIGVIYANQTSKSESSPEEPLFVG